MRISAAAAGLLLVAQLLSTAVLAHRGPESDSSIQWNKNSQYFEVIHRLHQHDLQALLRSRGLSDMASLRARATIALIVAENFVLLDEQGQPVPITTLGAVLEAEYIVVMQEFEAPPLPVVSASITLHKVLMASHVSRLRLLIPGANTLLRFDAGSDRQNIRLH